MGRNRERSLLGQLDRHNRIQASVTMDQEQYLEEYHEHQTDPLRE